MSCLPSYDEWSLRTKMALFAEHIEAMDAHISALAHQLPIDLLTKAEHLKEINTRSLEAHDLLLAIGKHPKEELESFEP